MARLKVAAGLLVGAVAAAGAVVGIFEVDEYADRDRPMYHDTYVMAGLQYDLLKSGKPGIEVSLDVTEPVHIGDAAFRTNPGVEIVVEERDGEYCVKGTNQYGSETDWECVDGTGLRPEPGAAEDL
ncbi:hypothetical protein F0U44_17815 [Nocardioides humilatus]|uniref:Uncharacterized protein n=1 Tax=Nocardioides humilatus TaxID=2607660 RepID=A0A5B1L8L1_9ACTN|nr:hypothetical protein [Nocardioides humilatus]KAA1417033.1 hypothetical protein F0U44_17815 [Nocardioides humilatus]